MKVSVLAFASAAEILGASEMTVDLAPESRIEDLKGILLATSPGLADIWDRLAIAVDDELAGPEAELSEGSEVALLPPVSGGSGNEPRVRLVDGEISTPSLIRNVSAPTRGAVVLFLGTVRNGSGNRDVAHLTYTAHRPLAEKTLERIVVELEAENPGLRMAIYHRLGRAEVGEVTVGIAAASPHRQLAYAASRTALERLKREVPIWKREEYVDGSVCWREEEPLRTTR